MKAKLQPSSCSFKAHQSQDIQYSHICATVCKKRLSQNRGKEMWVNWLYDLEQATCPPCEMKVFQPHSHLRKTPWLSWSWGNRMMSSLGYRWFILALGRRERTWVLPTCLCFMCWATFRSNRGSPTCPHPASYQPLLDRLLPFIVVLDVQPLESIWSSV